MQEGADSLEAVAEMSSFELMGNMTWRILPSRRFTPYGLFGYGVRWIEVEDRDGNEINYDSCSRDFSARFDWLRDAAACIFWPRVWHVGGGVDWTLYKNDEGTFMWTPSRFTTPDITLRLGYKATFQRLPTDDWGTRHDFNVSLTLGF
jgi:hypothetical protein